MSVNEKIKNSLKHGDLKRVAEILKVHPSTLSEKINAEKEIDSVDFINAVCRVTNKPFSFFKPVEGAIMNISSEDPAIYENPLKHMPEEREDATSLAIDVAVEHWKGKYEQEKRVNESLQQTIDAKDAHIAHLKETIDYMRKEKSGK